MNESTIFDEKKIENINKIKEDDRRFLMGVLNQNVQMLQSQHQFKVNTFLSYSAVYLSLVAVFIALGVISPYFYIITLIFIIAVVGIFWDKKEAELIKIQTKIYKGINSTHFNYLNKKKK